MHHKTNIFIKLTFLEILRFECFICNVLLRADIWSTNRGLQSVCVFNIIIPWKVKFCNIRKTIGCVRKWVSNVTSALFQFYRGGQFKVVPYTSGEIWSARLIFLFFLAVCLNISTLINIKILTNSNRLRAINSLATYQFFSLWFWSPRCLKSACKHHMIKPFNWF